MISGQLTSAARARRSIYRGPVTIALTLAVMVAFRVWSSTGRRRSPPIAGPLTAALLVLLSGLSPAQVGLTLAGWAYAAGGALAIAAGYLLAVAIPAARRAIAATSFPHPVRTALIGVPLATVTVEEVAFRGVLWVLIADGHGPVWATAVTALLFGLWHVSPAKPEKVVSREVVFTTLSGVVLGVLRHLSGGLLAPFVVHWTANGLGILVSAALSRSDPRVPDDPTGAR
jgi:membrane protease YdiL (CAAX protease family)